MPFIGAVMCLCVIVSMVYVGVVYMGVVYVGELWCMCVFEHACKCTAMFA